jgi:dinuclear metal center YbgI/SA1388 family protein
MRWVPASSCCAGHPRRPGKVSEQYRSGDSKERVATVPAIQDLIGTIEHFLEPRSYADYGPNGIQVPGPAEVAHVVTGVSASEELFARAAALDADLVLVHHGLFWKGPPKPLDAAGKRRLKLLFDHDMALAAYHLPLDGHQEHGNAAIIAAGLGATSWRPWGGSPPTGVVAELPAVPAAELYARVRELTGREPTAFLDGPDEVRTLGILTGAAAHAFDDAIEEGLDAFLTGEPIERVMTRARETRTHFLAAGHYATETFGVRRLGELLEAEHGVRHTFVDVPNPI